MVVIERCYDRFYRVMWENFKIGYFGGGGEWGGFDIVRKDFVEKLNFFFFLKFKVLYIYVLYVVEKGILFIFFIKVFSFKVFLYYFIGFVIVFFYGNYGIKWM